MSTTDFNPRSPHGERRRFVAEHPCPVYDFNPRSPHGERLAHAMAKEFPTEDFNPRSPHGERLTIADFARAALNISTHAPRTGSDDCYRKQLRAEWAFQPTLPARGATPPERKNYRRIWNFNPRSPHGERREQRL